MPSIQDFFQIKGSDENDEDAAMLSKNMSQPAGKRKRRVIYKKPAKSTATQLYTPLNFTGNLTKIKETLEGAIDLTNDMPDKQATPEMRPSASQDEILAETVHATPLSVSCSQPMLSQGGSVMKNPYENVMAACKSAHVLSQASATQMKVEAPPEKKKADGRSLKEIFASSLLSSPVEEYLGAAKQPALARQQWELVCKRLLLTPPAQRLLAKYANPEAHFRDRAALVVEEARHHIAEGLSQKWEKRLKWRKGPQVRVQLCRPLEASKHVEVILAADSFVKDKHGNSHRGFPKEHLEQIGSGNVYICVPRNASLARLQPHQTVFLHVSSANKESLIKKGTFDGMFYQENSLASRLETGHALDLYYFGATIGFSYDEFAVCYDERSSNVHVLRHLLGFPRLSLKEAADRPWPYKPRKVSFCEFRLNGSQDRAAKAFLEALPATITVVQGPPGTGKTTLLTGIIAKYIQASHSGRRKLLVCAPTNKAITVLARRFRDSITNWDACTLRVHLDGDEEKLLLDGYKKIEDNPLYAMLRKTWMKRMIEKYHSINQILNDFSPASILRARQLAIYLRDMLKDNLEMAWAEGRSPMAKAANFVCELFDRREHHHISGTIMSLASTLGTMQVKSSAFIKADLLLSCDVVFCTLAMVPKLASDLVSVDDVIIDEAAAATEPSLYLPLKVDPKRILVVGDPKQLPAVVTSTRSESLGLPESFHERIMSRCRNIDAITLDTQYRMHPQISAFPASFFYNGKLGDGPNVTNTGYNAGKSLLFDGQPFVFWPSTSAEQSVEGSLQNEGEARMILSLVRRLHQRGAAGWNDPDRLRIIAFYRSQVALLQSILAKAGYKDVLVGTVDSSQGCEADMVILSFVRRMSTAGFLSDDRRMNVALTRARHQLICVGNVYGMERLTDMSARALRALAQTARERGAIVGNPSASAGSPKGTNIFANGSSNVDEDEDSCDYNEREGAACSDLGDDLDEYL